MKSMHASLLGLLGICVIALGFAYADHRAQAGEKQKPEVTETREINYPTAKQLPELIKDAAFFKQDLLLFFWEKGCVPCSQQQAVIDAMWRAGSLKGLHAVVKIELPDETGTAKRFEVLAENTPVLVRLSKGQVFVGPPGVRDAEQLSSFLKWTYPVEKR